MITMITPFYRHGILSKNDSMNWIVQRLAKEGCFGKADNTTYQWKNDVVCSGLELANAVASTSGTDRVLLIGHSQGGLVCRVAAVALAGEHSGTCGPFTERIAKWQLEKGGRAARPSKLGVVTIATPNAGAMTFGQMSVAAELLGRTVARAAELLCRVSDLKDLTTPRLFQEFENWRVDARYLSISGVCVNRYRRGWVRNLAELWPIKRVSVRCDVPNDLVVEDSSSDLRQSVIRPEVDLANSYRHVRAYPESITLSHSGVRESEEVAKVIIENLCWLVP